MKKTLTKEDSKIIFIISLGIILRFWAMAYGSNYDFESYCIVGDLVTRFQNVYASTERYNYGPIFFYIQGFLYFLSNHISNDPIQTYRVLIVSLLTLTDLGITFFIASKYNIKTALLFFLNPISIIITGYHNQFDNMAILIGLLALLYYNEDEKFSKKDIAFVCLLSLSLIVKHILFILPAFLLFNKYLPLKKKIVYSFIPPIIIILSFVPFALEIRASFEGIMIHVFFYKSSKNSPLLGFLFNILGIDTGYIHVLLYMLIMLGFSILLRKVEFKKQFYFYLILMVAFSSAIANQYLIIPLAALYIFELKGFRIFYLLWNLIFLFLNSDELNLIEYVSQNCSSAVNTVARAILIYGYTVSAWILFFAFLYEMIHKRKEYFNVKVKEN